MRNSFRHLDFKARDRLEALRRAGHSQTEIAEVLGVNKSTISRELAKRKMQNGEYRASNAEHKAQVKRSRSKFQGMKIEKYPWLRKHIVSELKEFQSPDGIAGRMKEKRWPIRVSGDAIYRWLRSVYGQHYCKYLCTVNNEMPPVTHIEKHHAIVVASTPFF